MRLFITLLFTCFAVFLYGQDMTFEKVVSQGVDSIGNPVRLVSYEMRDSTVSGNQIDIRVIIYDSTEFINFLYHKAQEQYESAANAKAAQFVSNESKRDYLGAINQITGALDYESWASDNLNPFFQGEWVYFRGGNKYRITFNNKGEGRFNGNVVLRIQPYGANNFVLSDLNSDQNIAMYLIEGNTYLGRNQNLGKVALVRAKN